jgi:hypothetical protein
MTIATFRSLPLNLTHYIKKYANCFNISVGIFFLSFLFLLNIKLKKMRIGLGYCIISGNRGLQQRLFMKY